MDKLHISLWVVIFITIMVLFNISFRMVYTPVGLIGTISTANLIASSVYLIAWIFLSVISGIKRRKEILVATLIYCIMPIIGFLGALLIGTPFALLIMVFFYWTVPIQGIFIGNELSIGIGSIIIQPVIFVIGYSIALSVKQNMGQNNIF